MMNFIEGLRQTTQKNVLYKNPETLEEAIQEELKCNSAYFAAPSAAMYLRQLGGNHSSPSIPAPEPMDLSNMGTQPAPSSHPWQPRGGPRSELSVDEQRRRAQRTLDRLNGACYDCHRTGCRRGSPQCPKRTKTIQHQNVETAVKPFPDSGN